LVGSWAAGGGLVPNDQIARNFFAGDAGAVPNNGDVAAALGGSDIGHGAALLPKGNFSVGNLIAGFDIVGLAPGGAGGLRGPVLRLSL